MMIFLTVGLHEQPFDRLVQLVDELEGFDKTIQYGTSAYLPMRATAQPYMEFDEIRTFMAQADVVVTHGGTGSIMLALSCGKKPITAPRYKRYAEHVDDHQEEIVLELTRRDLVIPFRDKDDFNLAVKQAVGKQEIKTGMGKRAIDQVIIEAIESE